MLNRFKYLAAAAAILAATAIMVLSLLPGAYRLRLRGVPDVLEHFLAYAAFGALVAFAAGGRVGTLRLIAALVIFGGVLELGQVFSPERNAALRDYLFSLAGALTGVFAVSGAGFWRRSR